MPKAIIIGAGFGGLATAGLLAQQGYQVQVFEKNEGPGGRASIWREKGYTFDLGPSWYLMPDVFEHFFNQLGHSAQDFLQLKRLDPQYQAFFHPKTWSKFKQT